MKFPWLGRTVVLWSLPAHDPQNQPTTISGLFEVEDFVETERGPYVVLYDVRGIDDHDGDDYVVDPDALWEQVDPKGYGQMLVSDREMGQEDWGEPECPVCGGAHTPYCRTGTGR